MDDDLPTLLSLERVLRGERVRILTSPWPDDVLEWLAHLQVRAVITDERMPGMRGIELLSRVAEQYPRTARILLTGYATPDLFRACQRIGAWLIAKPCEPRELHEALVGILEGRRTSLDDE